jgi:excisionase family DNA binding protein
MQRIASSARLISTQEAADLLGVNQRTVTYWITQDRVPYIKLPGGGYRLPLGALLQSLSGNYDLLPHVKEVNSATADVEPRDDFDVAAAEEAKDE